MVEIRFVTMYRLDGTASHIECVWRLPDGSGGSDSQPVPPNANQSYLEAIMADWRRELELDPF